MTRQEVLQITREIEERLGWLRDEIFRLDARLVEAESLVDTASSLAPMDPIEQDEEWKEWASRAKRLSYGA